MERNRNAGILENVPAANRNLDNDLRRHLQQRVDAVAALQQLRADVKGIGGLLGEFDGTNRYFEDWEKQVRLVKRLFAVDDAIMKIIISCKFKGKADRFKTVQNRSTQR